MNNRYDVNGGTIESSGAYDEPMVQDDDYNNYDNYDDYGDYDRDQAYYLEVEQETELDRGIGEDDSRDVVHPDYLWEVWDNYFAEEAKEQRKQREQEEALYRPPHSNIGKRATGWIELIRVIPARYEIEFRGQGKAPRIYLEYTRRANSRYHKTHGRQRWSKLQAKARRAHQRAQEDNRYNLDNFEDFECFDYLDMFYEYDGPPGYAAVGTWTYKYKVHDEDGQWYDYCEIPNADDSKTWINW